VATELDFDVPVALEGGEAVQLRGRVDRLERDPSGALRVVDLKTGSSKPTTGEVGRHGQLGAYQAAVEHGAFAEHGSRSAGAALLQVGKAAGAKTTLQVQPPVTGDDDPDWADELITSTAEGMAGARFLATVGPACQFCAVRSSCPVQPEGRVI
jgi:RecB family exonuclease